MSTQPAVAAAAPGVDRKRFLAVFGAVMLPMFLAAVDQTVVATATPAIGHELGHLADMSWLAVSYLLASVAVVPLYGQCGDHFGRRRLLGVAVVLFTLGSLACGLATSFAALVAARVLQGLGGGGLMSLSQALIGEVLPPQQRARFQGWFAIVFISASLLGPLIGAAVVAHTSWRWLFLVNLPFAAFALWRLSTLPASGHPRPWQGRYDVEGTALFALAIVGTLLLMSEAGHAWPARTSLAAGAGVALAWALLLLVERRAVRRGATPFLPMDLLAVPAIRHAAGTVLGFAAVMFASIFYLPVYLHLAFGGPLSHSALLLLPLTGGMVCGAGLTGRLIVHTGRTREFPIAGMTLAAAALALLSVLPPQRGGVTLLTALAGFGLGSVMSVMQIVTQMIAGPARLGGAAATVSLARSLGASAGAAGFGALVFGAQASPDLAALQADPAALHAALQAFHHAFAAAAGLAALTALLATRLPSIRVDDSHSTRLAPLAE